MSRRLVLVATLLIAASSIATTGRLAHAADPPDTTTALSIDPPAATVAPGGLVVFQASGGSGEYSWSMHDSRSDGWIEPNGTYHAGLSPLVQDQVRVTDSFGTSATATIDVTYWEALVIQSPGGTLPPRGSRQIQAAGGVPPYEFSFVSNASVGSVSGSGFYQAGRKGKVIDVVRVTDAVGQTATVTFSISSGISVTPGTGKVPPHGRIDFDASGGSGTAFTWSIVENESGGTIDSATGAYQAGVGTHCADLVRAQDSLGNTAEVSVSVGDGVAIAPRNAWTFPGGSIAFEGFGGTNTFTWSLLSAPSGGTIEPTTGVYRAGPNGGVQDEVTAVDALGNRSIAVIDVGAALSLSPPSTSVETGTKVALSVAGGSGRYVWLVIESNLSGATITPELVYTAGSKAGRDTIAITDSVGATARAVVDVREPSRAPPAATPASSGAGTPPLSLAGGGSGGGCGTAPGSSAPSAGAAVLALGLAALVGRRRRRHG